MSQSITGRVPQYAGGLIFVAQSQTRASIDAQGNFSVPVQSNPSSQMVALTAPQGSPYGPLSLTVTLGSDATDISAQAAGAIMTVGAFIGIPNAGAIATDASGYAIVGSGGGGGGFPPADYNVTNAGCFTFPAPLVISATGAPSPTTITDTGGSGGFFVATDSDSGGINLQATGLSGISLNSQAGVTIDAGQSAQVQINGGSISIGSPAVIQAGSAQIYLALEAVNGQTADLLQAQSHTGARLSAINNIGQFVLARTSGAPSGTPTAGACCFDPATATLYIYDGSAWKAAILV